MRGLSKISRCIHLHKDCSIGANSSSVCFADTFTRKGRRRPQLHILASSRNDGEAGISGTQEPRPRSTVRPLAVSTNIARRPLGSRLSAQGRSGRDDAKSMGQTRGSDATPGGRQQIRSRRRRHAGMHRLTRPRAPGGHGWLVTVNAEPPPSRMAASDRRGTASPDQSAASPNAPSTSSSQWMSAMLHSLCVVVPVHSTPIDAKCLRSLWRRQRARRLAAPAAEASTFDQRAADATGLVYGEIGAEDQGPPRLCRADHQGRR